MEMQLTEDGLEMGRIAFDNAADGVFQLPSGRWVARCGPRMTKPGTQEEAQDALIDWKRGGGPEPWILLTTSVSVLCLLTSVLLAADVSPPAKDSGQRSAVRGQALPKIRSFSRDEQIAALLKGQRLFQPGEPQRTLMLSSNEWLTLSNARVQEALQALNPPAVDNPFIH